MIRKVDNHVELYRNLASAEDINHLTGRVGRADLTEYITKNIVAALDLQPRTRLVDIGCGDGRLLCHAARRVDLSLSTLVGILPTPEEVARIAQHVRRTSEQIRIELGRVDQVPVETGWADVVVCNSVFLYLFEPGLVDKALAEIARISRPGARIFLGEMLVSDEYAGDVDDRAVVRKVCAVFRSEGFLAGLKLVKWLVKAALSPKVTVLAPRKLFWAPVDSFVPQLARHGFRDIRHFPHREIDRDGSERVSRTRVDYVFTTAPSQ